MLSTEGARLADDAIARVTQAANTARAALAAESVTLVWLTGSSSARAAREESLRQTDKILAQLQAQRPGLHDGALPGFLQLASAGADVSALVESAKRMTGSGFVEEVVKPTVHQLDPTNLSGPVGKLALAGVALVVLFIVFKLTKD